MDSHISKENLRSKIGTDYFGRKTLNLSKWDLLELPEAVLELAELEKLDLLGNKLQTIPENVGKLNNITFLDVTGNQLSIFPPSLTQLKNLIWLSISLNKLTTISDAIGEMVALEGLDLSYNQFTVLSPAITQLKKLKRLYISHNKLATIPDAIGEMVALRELDLSYNQLTVLNPALKQLKEIQLLNVNGNPFTVEGMISVTELVDRRIFYRVPPDFLGPMRERLKAQLAYERALQDGYVMVYRGRILLIGQDRAGKTSLKKSLLGLPFDSGEQSTEGIEVDPSKCEIDVDQAARNWQSIGENKPGLLECSKDVAKIVAEKLFTQEDDLAKKISMQQEKLRQKKHR